MLDCTGSLHPDSDWKEPNAAIDMDAFIVHMLYCVMVKALDEIESGDVRRGALTLRQYLPQQYRHAFRKSANA